MLNLTLWVEVTEGKINHSAMFCDRKDCGSGHTIFLVCHMTYKNHGIDYMAIGLHG